MKFYFCGIGVFEQCLSMLGLSLVDAMKKSRYYQITGKLLPINRLESFYYLRQGSNKSQLWENDFPGEKLLDSGAYTWQAACLGKGLPPPSHEEIVDYLKEYCKYINENNIRDYIEFDTEEVVGWKRYYYYLKLMEDLTGIAPRMIWHNHRGIEWLHKYGADPNYPRLGVGGIVANYVSKEIISYEKKVLIPMAVDIMRSYGKQVHGLGITGDWFVKQCAFTSIDTVSWLSECKWNSGMHFDGHSLVSMPDWKMAGRPWQVVMTRTVAKYIDYAAALLQIQ